MPDWFFWLAVVVVVLTLLALIGGWLGEDEQLFAAGLQMLITIIAATVVTLITIYAGPVIGLFSKALAAFLTGIL